MGPYYFQVSFIYANAADPLHNPEGDAILIEGEDAETHTRGRNLLKVTEPLRDDVSSGLPKHQLLAQSPFYTVHQKRHSGRKFYLLLSLFPCACLSLPPQNPYYGRTVCPVLLYSQHASASSWALEN